MGLGAGFIIVGTAVQATSTNIGTFMAGRFLLGFGVATSATAGPAYVSEMAHPVFRGTMTGLYNVLWFGGGIPGTFIPWRTSKIQGTASWRIPVWLQMFFSGIVLLGSFFLPEVSRYPLQLASVAPANLPFSLLAGLFRGIGITRRSKC